MDIDVDARNCNSEFGSLDNIRDNMVKKRNLCRQQSDPTDTMNSDIQRSLIQRDLVDKVHGQKASINVVVRSLQERKNWKCKIKVLSFVGSTGTGKTFVANILKSHFPNELIHELYGVQLHYKTEHEKILSDLSSYNLNLVIVDDIKRGDITDLLV
ncbi:hypothetical protein NQ317_006399 [Molorchus minor]|uniref:Uncharacterized protein n=1 Tax=Molorchus minor TaxID=1323400 RepID=A0ABQ9IZH2_9CUCU|nr:hypothetical protein NQ317_006399 [Molorchus minor]